MDTGHERNYRKRCQRRTEAKPEGQTAVGQGTETADRERGDETRHVGIAGVAAL